MTVRSLRAFGPVAISGGGRIALYTVPAGRTLRLSSLRATAVTGGVLFIFVDNGVVGTRNVGNNSDTEFIDGAWVFGPGDVIEAQSLLVSYVGGVTGMGSLLLGEPT